MSLIAIENVRKSYGTNAVLNGIDLNINAGEVIVIIDKSGSGKSTLLRCINGLESIDEGKISVGDAALGSSEQDLRRLRANWPKPTWRASVWPKSSTAILTSCPAASNSASPLHAP